MLNNRQNKTTHIILKHPLLKYTVQNEIFIYETRITYVVAVPLDIKAILTNRLRNVLQKKTASLEFIPNHCNAYNR